LNDLLIEYWGNKDFFAQRTPQNYTINDFNNKTGFGATASVAYVKYPEGYGVAWTVQANYLFNSYAWLDEETYPGFNLYECDRCYKPAIYVDLWFSPDWDINNSTNINFICRQHIISISKGDETNSSAVIDNYWSYGAFRSNKSEDLNTPISIGLNR